MRYASEDYLFYLESEVIRLRKENEELRANQAKNIDIMIQGEALRNQMLFNVIINGAFDKKK